MERRRLKVAIVADDLTGAMDAAGPFAAGGHTTRVVVDHAACEPSHLAGAAVVSLNAASRHLPALQAAERVREIAARLVPRDTELLLKKIDSTLRGNVAAETLALLDASGRRNVVLAPAFPAQGRTVRSGIVHVHGVPLAQTSFARDALSPPPLEPLDAVFKRAAPDARVERIGAGGPFNLAGRAERCVLVVDTETDADLQTSIRSLGGQLADCVLVGSAGIAQAIARTHLRSAGGPVAPRSVGPILVVVGSRAQQSAEQVNALGSLVGAQIFPAPNGQIKDAAFFTCSAPVRVLVATPGAHGMEGDPEAVAAGLAAAVVRALASAPVAAVVATGGDTAVAILHALRQPVLEVLGDLLPGIPYGRLAASAGSVCLVTKAGGFGARDTLVEIVRGLRRAH